DEPLLAQALVHMLSTQWPALQIQAVAGDGISAAAQALQLLPDVLFLDIRMPGQSGLEAAAEIADAWPEDKPLPAIVFVTAYDQYALAAFEACAMDYVLKPVQPLRLAQSVQRLQHWWQQRQSAQDAPPPQTLEQTLEQLLALQQRMQTNSAAPLQIIQASVGAQIHMV
ncbi:MAG: response regulator, partial [Comamonas sp.]